MCLHISRIPIPFQVVLCAAGGGGVSPGFGQAVVAGRRGIHLHRPSHPVRALVYGVHAHQGKKDGTV